MFYFSGLLELCKNNGVVKFNESCPLWELPSAVKGDHDSNGKLQKETTKFKSKSGHELIMKKLDGLEHGMYWSARQTIS